MRRIATALGILAAAATLALTVPGSAYAAQGVLSINGVEYHDPSGCYEIGSFPYGVVNHTDRTALVLTGRGCTGKVDAVVDPGRSKNGELGNSVYIP